MSKSQETWNKKEKEKKRQKKKEEKAQRKEVRKANASDGSLESMMAYVDEFGNISSTPPDPLKRRSTINPDNIEVGVPRRKPAEETDPNRKGIVTFFNESKGYGFIKDQVTQESVFVHVNSLTEAVKENSKVIFEVEMGPKGANAVNVKLAG